MVSALDSGSSALGSNPGPRHRVVFLGKTQVRVPCDGLVSHPGGSTNTASRFMQQKPGISAYADFT